MRRESQPSKRWSLVQQMISDDGTHRPSSRPADDGSHFKSHRPDKAPACLDLTPSCVSHFSSLPPTSPNAFSLSSAFALQFLSPLPPQTRPSWLLHCLTTIPRCCNGLSSVASRIALHKHPPHNQPSSHRLSIHLDTSNKVSRTEIPENTTMTRRVVYGIGLWASIAGTTTRSVCSTDVVTVRLT